MRSKPKTEPSDTTAPCDAAQGGDAGVWDNPGLKELADLTDKLMKVPKKELDEKLAKERAAKKKRHG